MKEWNAVAKALTMLLQVAITMMSPLVVCGVIGYMLNQRFDTTLWFLVMMVLGVMAAFRNFFHLLRGFYEKDLKEEKAKQEYFDSLKRERLERQKENKRDKNS